MCGCSGRSGGSLAGPGWPWQVNRPGTSPDFYQDGGQAQYAAAITGGKRVWIGEGPEPGTAEEPVAPVLEVGV